MPFFLYLCVVFMEDKKVWNSIWLGIMYGVVGLTHNVAFIAASFFLAIMLVYIFITDLRKDKGSWKRNLWLLAIPVVIGVPIALLWWYSPIFVHMGKTANNFSDWTNPLWQGKQQFEFFWGTIKGNFLSISSIRAAAWSLFNLLGILGLFIVKDREKVRMVRLFVISSLVITMHYLVTQALFGFNLVPHYMDSLILLPTFAMLFALGAYVLFSFIHSNISGKLLKIIFEYAFYLILAVLVLLVSFKTMSDVKSDTFFSAGKSEPPAYLLSLRDYFEDNSVSVYDTVLTTKELGFSLNAMTGRKLLTSRWGHTDPFFDLQDRELASAIILYGEDLEARKELLRKYGIKYLYWDYYWIRSEYYVNEQGQVTGWFDPLMVFYSKEREDLLKANNVSYILQNTWPDPALKSDNFKKYDLILISPENYQNETHPWKEGLEPYLEEAWSYSQGGTEIAKLYKIVNI
jgi:hypothetical protein